VKHLAADAYLGSTEEKGTVSEYQYYEFLAIDRPLTEDEMGELRKLSARATITPVSFANEYYWGDFKGDPEKLMQRYFDAHVCGQMDDGHFHGTSAH
jgi:hypothetical protein